MKWVAVILMGILMSGCAMGVTHRQLGRNLYDVTAKSRNLSMACMDFYNYAGNLCGGKEMLSLIDSRVNIMSGTFVGRIKCSQKGYWAKENTPKSEWQRDFYECKMDAQMINRQIDPYEDGCTLLYRSLRIYRHFDSCLQAKGYERVEKPKEETPREETPAHQPPSGANWTVLKESENNPNERVYISGIRSLSEGDLTAWRYWLKFDTPGEKIGGKEIDEYVTLDEINCKTGMERSLSFIFYFKGRVIYKRDPVTGDAGKWKHIVPGSLTDDQYKLLCNPTEGEETNRLSPVHPSTGKKLFRAKGSNFGIWYDDSKWQVSTNPDEKGGGKFNFIRGDGYAEVVVVPIELPIGTLKELALKDAYCPDCQLVFEEKRLVNGIEILCLQTESTIGEPITIYGYYYSGKEETIEVLTITRQSSFAKNREEFTNFLNGLVVLSK